MTIALFLLIVAVICFLVDAVRSAIARSFNGIAWGLALTVFAVWVLPHIIK